MRTLLHVITLLLLNFMVWDSATAQADDQTGVKDESKVLQENQGMFYAFFITTTDEHGLQDFLKVYPEMEASVEQIDTRNFRIGKIRTHAKAVAIQEKMTEAGLLMNTLVAFDNEKQIPVFLAMSRENMKKAEVARK